MASDFLFLFQIFVHQQPDLSIRVTRFREEADEDLIREYCVAEVYATEQSPLFTIATPAGGKRPSGPD